MTNPSPIYDSAKAIAEQYGIDASIEIHSAAFDAVCPGLGDVLRTLWADIRGDLMRTPAHLSGATHELELYGGPA